MCTFCTQFQTIYLNCIIRLIFVLYIFENLPHTFLKFDALSIFLKILLPEYLIQIFLHDGPNHVVLKTVLNNNCPKSKLRLLLLVFGFVPKFCALNFALMPWIFWKFLAPNIFALHSNHKIYNFCVCLEIFNARFF